MNLPLRSLPATALSAMAACLLLPATGAEITQNGIQTAFRVLQKEYIRRDDLTFDELNRAALQGLLTRLQFGAELVRRDKDALPAANAGLVATVLLQKIALLRPGTLDLKETAAVEQKLAAFGSQGIEHLILDLRVPAAPGDFDAAAAFLSLFVPRGEILFKTRQMAGTGTEVLRNEREPLWPRTLLVLVDHETSNVGEAVAGALRQRGQALVLGAATRGAAVRYETVPVDAEWALRFARAEVLLADDRPLFQKGVQPDLPVTLAPEMKRLLFLPSQPTAPLEAIRDLPRPRFNEAALVAGTNPELDDLIRRGKGETLPQDAPRAQDRVLQRAVDLLLTRQHLQGVKLDWKPKRSTAPGVRRAIPVNE
ncbi:MAG: hypothetical protein IPK32_26070 [Verrucomicrobiaceae bacterium]|nr:hypothetical protein [Verrucomicrobiaceae bacterium]